MYSDSNASRRNLTIVSLGFIIFRHGEGEIDGDKISLPLINLTLDNPEFIAFFLWVMIFWFAYRYWQVNYTEDRNKLKQDLNNALHNKRLKFFDAIKSHRPDLGVISNGVVNDKWIWLFKCSIIRQGRGNVTENIELNGWKWWRIKLYVWLYVLIGPYNTLTGMIITPGIFLYAVTPYISQAFGAFLSGARLLLNGIPGLV